MGNNFSNAIIVVDAIATEVERKAALVLTQEINKRTNIQLPVSHKLHDQSQKRILVGTYKLLEQYEDIKAQIDILSKPKAEGYRIFIKESTIAVIGEDSRGVLYGVGKLLRIMEWGKGYIAFPCGYAVSSSPESTVRGHQLGYRPKTNAYDAWTPEIYEQYIRELALFGANSIELLPPTTDDDLTCPHIKYDPFEMMCKLSDIVHSYGMDTWVWYPNLDREYIDSSCDTAWEEESRKIFKAVPYIDHVFVPGGDPGDLKPKQLFAWSKRVQELLTEYHSNAKVWVSPQTGTPSVEWVEEFYSEVEKNPNWLFGIVFAPWERDSIEELRKRILPNFPIRNYPDITHSYRCQYPVPKWDMPLALSLGRECINPRPYDEKNIHNLYHTYFVGSVTYSEGINDDVNKFVWLDQEWNSSTPVINTLREFAGLFIDYKKSDDIAQGLLALERNLRGQLEQNNSVETTFAQWLEIEKTVCSYGVDNYRLEMALIRAYFDIYQKNRYIYESSLEKQALYELSKSDEETVIERIQNAKDIMLLARTKPICMEWKDRINNLADLLFEHIGAQLTVTRHAAAAWDRGAFVECVDIPLNDFRYIMSQIKIAEGNSSNAEKLSIVHQLVHRTDPGIGGFYDNMGSWGSWHRLENHDMYNQDPAFLDIPLSSFLMQPPHDKDDNNCVPLAWQWNVYTLYQKPLVITYKELDPNANYKIRTTYGRYHTVNISLLAGVSREYKIHEPVLVDKSFCTTENKIPKEAYESGTLILNFVVKDGERGPNVSEIFIIKE